MKDDFDSDSDSDSDSDFEPETAVYSVLPGTVCFEPGRKEESSGDSLSVTSVFSVVKYRTYAEGIAWHLCNVEINRVAFSVCELIGWKFLLFF